MKARKCSACGVPKLVSKGHEWTSGGAIVSKKNPVFRMIFWESDYISRVLGILQQITEVPLERMVIELTRKASHDYVTSYIYPALLKVINRVSLNPFTKNLLSLLRAYGFGEASFHEVQYRKGEDDYVIVKVKNPYYLPSCAGTLLGGVEAVCGREGSVRNEEIAPGEYLLDAYISNHPMEFSGRLHLRHYPAKPGEIAFERCPSCGSPANSPPTTGTWRGGSSRGSRTERAWRWEPSGSTTRSSRT